MTEEQKAAYVHAQSVAMQCEMQAMLCENIERMSQNKALAYGAKAFSDLPAQYGLSHNQLIELFHDIPRTY
jgi:hypothetical protein